MTEGNENKSLSKKSKKPGVPAKEEKVDEENKTSISSEMASKMLERDLQRMVPDVRSP